MADQSPQSSDKNPNRDSGLKKTDKSYSLKELDAVRNCMVVFSIAIKNYPLYPDDHAITENLLRRFKNSLANYFRISPILKLDIEKERVLLKGVEVYRSNEREDHLVTPFFRDGIVWIEFNEGVQNSELSSLLQSLNDYRILKVESEGDLVTSLWKKEFPHIDYEATEIYWETEPKLDFSQYNVNGTPNEELKDPLSSGGSGSDHDQQTKTGDVKDQTAINIASAEDVEDSTQLIPEEKKKVQQLIIEEEKRNHTEDILDVLLILLEDEKEPEAFDSILKILVQEFEIILNHGEFYLALKLFDHLKNISSSKSTQKPIGNNLNGQLAGPYAR